MRLWTELLTTKPASTRGIDSQRGRSCNQSWSGTPRGRRSGVSAVGRQHEQGPASSRPVPGPTPSPERPLAPAGSTAGYIPTHPSGACPERDGDSNSQEASHSSALRRKRRDSSRKASTRSFSATIAFSNSRMILKQVWVGKGTEVGSELLSRGFRCGDGEGGGGLRGRGKLCRVVLRARKLVELPSPPPIPEESRADRPVSGRCLTSVTGSPPAVFSCVAASAARTRCRSSGVLVVREKRP